MYKIDDVGSLYQSLPPNLQTIENDCLGYAIDRQFAKLYKIAKELTIWSDLDGVNPRYYDQIAKTARASYYKSEYDDKKKLGIIKSAVMTRRHSGSVKAVEELVSKAFYYADFIPWYEYNGEPYHFKIIIKDEPDSESKQLFEEMLKKTKAARSIIDGVEIDSDKLSMQLYTGLAVQQVRIVSIPNMEDTCKRIDLQRYIGMAVQQNKLISIPNMENICNDLDNTYYVSMKQVIAKDLMIEGGSY